MTAFGALVLTACATSSHVASPANPAASATPSARALVLRATACWMGGIWGDGLGQDGDSRATGIAQRCNALLREVDVTKGEKERARADGVPPPAPEEAYYPLRAVEPHIVDLIAAEVAARAAKDPVDGPNGQALVTLVRSVAAATRETVEARRAADVVKGDVLGQPASPSYAADKADAAAKLEARAGIDALFALDAGPFAEEARAVGLLTALDRMEIARGLPKHLKIYAVGSSWSDVFHVAAPAVGAPPATPLPSGTWLTYLTQVAAAAGHPVPGDAHDPQNREALAWSGVLEGFADLLYTSTAHTEGTPHELGNVANAVARRLQEEFARDREVYEAHASKDR
jgi:hypothetical protein